MDGRTDTELIAAYAASKDEAAFTALIERHQRMVFRTCLRMLGAVQDAEDATQATFVVLMKKADKLKREGGLGGWLHAVARRVSLETINRRMVEARGTEAAALAKNADGAGQTADVEAVLRSLDAEMERLTPAQRQAVVLRYLEGHSQEKCARLAGCPVGTLSRRASEGIAKLRARLARRGIALGVPVLVAVLESEAHAAIPQTLLASTMTAVNACAAGGLASVALGAKEVAVSAKVVALAKGALNAMFWSTVKTAVVATAAVTLVGSAGVAVVLATSRHEERAATPGGPVHAARSVEVVSNPADGDVVCSNIQVLPRDDKTATITVDLAWGPSWRSDENHVAAWIFFKVRAEGSRAWQHVRLAAGKVLNPTGYGCAQSNEKMDVLVPSGEDGFTGMLIRQSSLGELRAVEMKGVTAVWDLASTPGISKDTKVQVDAFGLVMVYVPRGPFYLGSGGTEPCGFYQYTDGKQDIQPYRVKGTGPIPTGTQNGWLWARGAEPMASGEIPATFPNGYGAFYCAYYPLSGSQYAHFLNRLPPEQAAEHYRQPPEDSQPGTKSSRPAPRAGEIWRSGTAPNCTYAYERYHPGSRPSRVGVRWLSWADAAAYLAWAGLRPMTELEYEKALRGSREPVPDETDHSYWNLPTRSSDGSGWPCERTVTAAAIQGWAPDTFRGTHGLGTATPPPDWPQANAAGVGIRGGHAAGNDGDPLGGPEFSRTSNRSAAALADPERRGEFGIRAVRTAPEG